MRSTFTHNLHHESFSTHSLSSLASLAFPRYKSSGYLAAANDEKKLKKLSLAQQEECRIMHKQVNKMNLMARKLKKEIALDNKVSAVVVASLQDSMSHSLKNFVHGLTLAGGDGVDLSKHVFRLVSIWFANSGEDGVNKTIGETSGRGMPSWLFVPLIAQLFARVGAGGESFQVRASVRAMRAQNKEVGASAEGCCVPPPHPPPHPPHQTTLSSLVLRIMRDHPHHSLTAMIALSNGDGEATGSRVGEAAKLLAALRRTGGAEVKGLCDSSERLSSAYIALAMAPTAAWVAAKQTSSINLGSSMKKGKGITLDRALGSPWSSRRGGGWGGGDVVLPAILTKPPMLRRDGDYGNLVGSERIVGFVETFALTETGLHRPKIVKAVGESGRFFKQLVKGDDDIRQDAVMEQVFSLTNRVLARQGKELLQVSTRLTMFECALTCPPHSN